MRALSSAGSERLPYKQRVGGSNPSAPTTRENKDRVAEESVAQAVRKLEAVGHTSSHAIMRALSSAGSERLPYKQRVGGSNPSAPTHPKH